MTIQSKYEQIEGFIDSNDIFRIMEGEHRKWRKENQKNYTFIEKSELTTEKWNLISPCWSLSNNVQEYYFLIELDILEIYKLLSYKLLNDFIGVRK